MAPEIGAGRDSKHGSARDCLKGTMKTTREPLVHPLRSAGAIRMCDERRLVSISPQYRGRHCAVAISPWAAARSPPGHQFAESTKREIAALLECATVSTGAVYRILNVVVVSKADAHDFRRNDTAAVIDRPESDLLRGQSLARSLYAPFLDGRNGRDRDAARAERHDAEPSRCSPASSHRARFEDLAMPLLWPERHHGAAL